jgi:hypothetical protein
VRRSKILRLIKTSKNVIKRVKRHFVFRDLFCNSVVFDNDVGRFLRALPPISTDNAPLPSASLRPEHKAAVTAIRLEAYI